MNNNTDSATPGFLFAVTSSLLWGVFPLYYVMLNDVDIRLVVAYRLLCAFPFILIAIICQRRISQSCLALRSALSYWPVFLISTLLIGTSWSINVWAVPNGFVTETSMGYFLTPLMSVVAGHFIFKEHLSRYQWFAVAIAAISVGYFIIAVGILPWIGFIVGLLFAIYGVIRKKISIAAMDGMLIETGLMFPVGVVMILTLYLQSGIWTGYDLLTDSLLFGSGAFTVLPVIFYVAATRRLNLSTVGLLFYLAPSLNFLLGVFYLNEAFSIHHILMFVGIWFALAIYSFDSFLQHKTLATT